MKGFDMSQFEDCEGEEMIDPVEHLESLNDKQKEFLKLAVKNHEEYEALRRKYRDELDALNKKYEELQKPIFEERRQIVAGEKSLEEAKLEAEKMAQEGRLPDFWYHVLRNNDMVREMSRLSDRDKDCMKHMKKCDSATQAQCLEKLKNGTMPCPSGKTCPKDPSNTPK